MSTRLNLPNLTIGQQQIPLTLRWPPPSVHVVAGGVGLGHRQVIGVEIHADSAMLPVSHHRHVHHLRGGEHSPALLVPLETEFIL